MSGTMSKWTALVTQQVYKHIHTFLEVDATVSLTYKGPAKSTPVKEKGCASMARKEGSGGQVVGSRACPGTCDMSHTCTKSSSQVAFHSPTDTSTSALSVLLSLRCA